MRVKLAYISALVVSAAVLAACDSERDGVSRDSAASPHATKLEWEGEFAADVGERIGQSLMGREPDVAGVRYYQLQTEWTAVALTSACNLDMDLSLPRSGYGRQRAWRSVERSTPSGTPRLEIHQFAAAFGMPEVAELIDYVPSLLTCETYRDRQGEHLMLGEVTLPDLEGVDAAFAFCEGTPESWFRGELQRETRHQCTVILGRDDIATRIRVDAEDLQYAREVATDLAGVAARVLGAAW
jgi:hypothetical protein